jgi:DNA-binding NarL/FixJ family response regulator
MMRTQHLFLSSPVAHVPDRLHEAFADIQALDAAALLVRLAGLPAASCLVWLSNADPQWLAALQYVLQAQADARVVLLSSVPESTEGLSALNAGARGYTHAYGVPALLQEVALVIEHGGLWVGPDLLQRLVGSTSAALAARPAANPTSNAWSTLSAREAEVARSVLAGCSNKEVATKMFISERTVKAHMGAVFEKLGVRDRLQLVLRLSASGDPKLSPFKETAA